MITPQYIHLKPTSSLQDVVMEGPFAAVVVIDMTVNSEWRQTVSERLVDQGCLYMMAHGDECSLWDDSVDIAHLEACDWNFDDIPEDKHVTTTWHENESLEEVFFFAKNCALPFSPLIKKIFILDITKKSREASMLLRYEAANGEDVNDKTDYLDLYASYWKKLFKASTGPLDQRLAVMGPIFIFMVLCLLLWGLVDYIRLNFL